MLWTMLRSRRRPNYPRSRLRLILARRLRGISERLLVCRLRDSGLSGQVGVQVDFPASLAAMIARVVTRTRSTMRRTWLVGTLRSVDQKAILSSLTPLRLEVWEDGEVNAAAMSAARVQPRRRSGRRLMTTMTMMRLQTLERQWTESCTSETARAHSLILSKMRVRRVVMKTSLSRYDRDGRAEASVVWKVLHNVRGLSSVGMFDNRFGCIRSIIPRIELVLRWLSLLLGFTTAMCHTPRIGSSCVWESDSVCVFRSLRISRAIHRLWPFADRRNAISIYIHTGMRQFRPPLDLESIPFSKLLIWGASPTIFPSLASW